MTLGSGSASPGSRSAWRGDAARRGALLRPLRRLGLAGALPRAVDDPCLRRAATTQRIRLGTWVTNPLSRHPLVTAACARPWTTLRPGASTSGSAPAGPGFGTSAWPPPSSRAGGVRPRRPGAARDGRCRLDGARADSAVGRPATDPDRHGRPRLALAGARGPGRRRRRWSGSASRPRRWRAPSSCSSGRSRGGSLARRPRGLVHVLLVGGRAARQGQGGGAWSATAFALHFADSGSRASSSRRS